MIVSSNVDDDRVRRIPSLLRGSVGNNVTSKVILIVLYYIIVALPSGDDIVVFDHVKALKEST